jgi:hypothetical protein
MLLNNARNGNCRVPFVAGRYWLMVGAVLLSQDRLVGASGGMNFGVPPSAFGTR